jgi:hypothetical protein
MYRLITFSGAEIRRSTVLESLQEFLGYLDARIQFLGATGWETLP